MDLDYTLQICDYCPVSPPLNLRLDDDDFDIKKVSHFLRNVNPREYIQDEYFTGSIDYLSLQLQKENYDRVFATTKCLLKAAEQENEVLPKLLTICRIMRDIARRLGRLDKNKTFIDHYSIVDDLFEAVLIVEDGSIEKKCIMVVWSLVYIGACSMEVEDYSRCIACYDKAIFLMKSNFGARARYFRVYSICWNNFGIAHQRIGNYEKACQALQKAISINKTVSDWIDDKERKRCISESILNQKRLQQQTFYYSYKMDQI